MSTVDSGRDLCWTEARTLRHSVGAKNDGLWLWYTPFFLATVLFCLVLLTFEAVAGGGDSTP